MKKEKIFSKFNTRVYNDELEEVLANKPFSETVKNNILNMVYKIEESYDDFKNVKIEIQSEKDFMEKLLKIIKEYCNSIQILNCTEMKNKNYVVDFKNGNIKTLPNNNWILYSLLSLQKKEKIYKNELDIIYKKSIYDFLYIGYITNKVEVLRDFSGWSWVSSIDEIENKDANIVYQNLQYLLGNKYMENFMQNVIVKENDFIEILYNKLEKRLDKELAKRIIELLKRISIVEISNIDGKYKKTLIEIKQRKLEELNFMENKKEYLKEITYIKKTNMEIIKGIDRTINDKDLLKIEYKLRNSMLKNEEKIFSISYLVDMLNEERQEALDKIAEINTLMEPKTYIQKKDQIKNIVDEISVNEKELTNSENEILELQKVFIKSFLDEIKFATEKSDIIKALYKVRYYNNILYSENKYIKDIKEIKEEIEELNERMIEKLLENKLVFEFSDKNEINKEIIKNILTVKIINLQSVYIMLTQDKNEIKMKIYDEDEVELVKSINNQNIKNKDLKLDKKIKLFM